MQLKSSSICVCLLMLASTVGTYASATMSRLHNDAHPGKCFVNDELILWPGEMSKDPDDCAAVFCNTAEGWATMADCETVERPYGCYYSGKVNLKDPFPECCEQQLKCKN